MLGLREWRCKLGTMAGVGSEGDGPEGKAGRSAAGAHGGVDPLGLQGRRPLPAVQCQGPDRAALGCAQGASQIPLLVLRFLWDSLASTMARPACKPPSVGPCCAILCRCCFVGLSFSQCPLGWAVNWCCANCRCTRPTSTAGCPGPAFPLLEAGGPGFQPDIIHFSYLSAPGGSCRIMSIIHFGHLT